MSLTDTLRLASRPRKVKSRSLNLRSGLWLAWGLISLVVIAALFPHWFTHYDPYNGVAGTQLTAPDSQHWLGTDQLGRDLYSRIIYGARWSLSAASAAVAVGLVLGSLTGMLAAFCGGVAESLTMRIADVLLSIPALLLSLSIIILLGSVICMQPWRWDVRRWRTLRGWRGLKCSVSANRIISKQPLAVADVFAVFFRHVIPNALPTLLAFSALQFGQAILALSTLSFLGFGSPPPIPEWGLLIAEGRNYLATAWWLTVFPGLLVISVVLATHRISRAFSGEGR